MFLKKKKNWVEWRWVKLSSLRKIEYALFRLKGVRFWSMSVGLLEHSLHFHILKVSEVLLFKKKKRQYSLNLFNFNMFPPLCLPITILQNSFPQTEVWEILTQNKQKIPCTENSVHVNTAQLLRSNETICVNLTCLLQKPLPKKDKTLNQLNFNACFRKFMKINLPK